MAHNAPGRHYRDTLMQLAEVVAETAAGSDIDKRIYQSWLGFRQRAVDIAPLSMLGYMQSRNS